MALSGAFEATVEVVKAKLSNDSFRPTKETGKEVAAYIHEIYREFSKIEVAELDKSGYVATAVVFED